MDLTQKLVTDESVRKYTGVYFLGQNTTWWARSIAWFQIVVYNIALSVYVTSLVMLVVPILEGKPIQHLDQYQIENLNVDPIVAVNYEIAQSALKMFFAMIQLTLGIILLQGVGQENRTKVSVWTVGTAAMVILNIAMISTSAIIGEDYGAGEPNFVKIVLWDLPWILLSIQFLWIVTIYKNELTKLQKVKDYILVSSKPFPGTLIV